MRASRLIGVVVLGALTPVVSAALALPLPGAVDGRGTLAAACSPSGNAAVHLDLAHGPGEPQYWTWAGTLAVPDCGVAAVCSAEGRGLTEPIALTCGPAGPSGTIGPFYTCTPGPMARPAVWLGWAEARLLVDGRPVEGRLDLVLAGRVDAINPCV